MDLRTRTTLVCGALALAIAVSIVLRGKTRTVHWLFFAFSVDIGFWYLSQSLFGLFEDPIWDRLRVVLAVLLPAFAVNLFESMVPTEDDSPHRSRLGRWSWLLAAVMLVLAISPLLEFAIARIALFLYVVTLIALGLNAMGQRGKRSRSRDAQKRVRFLVVTGAAAGLFSVADFAWVIGYAPEYYPPPVGVVLSVVFLFMLAQALRHERLLDLYEMLGRLLVAILVAFALAGVFYFLVTVIGQFETMYLNAILVAIVVLVLFNPLRDKVEQQMQRLVFRERRRLEDSLREAGRRLAYTLEIEDLGGVVMAALERSRSITCAALYIRQREGTGFEQLGSLGGKSPRHIDVATAHPLLERLEEKSVVIEEVRRELQEHRAQESAGHCGAESVLVASEVLGSLRSNAVVVGIRAELGELVGLLVVADDRFSDSFGIEDVGLLEQLAVQIGVVIQNSRVYAKMKERDRLAVLGQMAAGLAHEIRNPLGAIKGSAQLLAEPGPDGQQLDASSKEFLEIIIEEVNRLDHVVGSMLDLVRRDTDVVAPIDINSELRRTVKLLSAEWLGKKHTINLHLQEELPRVAIAIEQLRQVMMNLLRNAEQAMIGRGRIDITTKLRLVDDRRYVDISVTDSGTGISRKSLPNIFLPFFTTKGAGTGLGLAICQRIIRDAGGRIEVSSKEGTGTTFLIVLPAAMEALGTPAPALAEDMDGDLDGDSENPDAAAVPNET